MAEVELQQIGVYTVTGLLRVSSASTFYQGKLRKKTLLIKKLHVPLPASEDKEAFFLRAKQLKKLKNRNITNVIDVCFVGDYPCLVMEYVAGETLQQLIPPGTQLASDEVKRYLAPAADAIHYAHVNNVLHKNLHPGNLLLAEHNTLLLTEFSLALPNRDLPLDDEDFAAPYMAPEHLQGQPTFASDQYSLAVMAYEWLCGRRPYEATERDLLLQQQTQAAFPLPRSLNDSISVAVERVLVQALSYDSTARFPHTLEFFNQYLGALMGFPVKTRQPATTHTTIVIGEQVRSKASLKDGSQNVIPLVPQVNINVDLVDGVGSMSLPHIECGTCGETNRADAKYCISCGKTLKASSTNSHTTNSKITIDPSTIECSSCGAVNPKNAKYCLCGRTVQSASLPLVPSKQALTSSNIVGVMIKKYRLMSLLGEGGYGAVYKAQDIELERIVAIKKLLQDGLSSQEAVKAAQDFKSEANILAKIDHVSIPTIHEHFSWDGNYYIVMKYIEGDTLEKRILDAKDSRFTIKDTINVGIQLCAVLNYLHNNSIPVIFRDLKPSNIMLDSEDSVYLLDFGIARHFKPGKSKDTTQFGTLGYASPEQFGSNQTDARSDIYSLGALLHQLLSGNDPSQTPFNFAPLQLGNHQIYTDLSMLIMHMVAHESDKRPASMSIIQQELQRISGQLRSIQGTSLPKPNQIILSSSDNVSHNAITDALNNPSAPQTDILADKNKLIFPKGKESDLHSIVEDDLRQGGVLSQQLPGYEERPAQIEMATTVARSLTQSVPSIIEAGTGTGKSLAYLLPIVRSGKVAIVSTANKALQEQLFYKDIPFVQKHIKPFEAALVKGTANYVCMDRMESERVGMQFYAKNQDFKRLLRVIEDPDSTFAGDFETLGFQLPGDIRSRVATDSDQCAWSKCEFFGDCYVRRMRARAERAQVIVVNHTLLLLDAAMEGYLLPERDVIVLDEAHHLEEEATRSFTVTIGPMQVQTLLAQKMLKDHSLLHLQDETLQAAEHMWSRLYQVANPGYKGRVNLTEPLEEGLRLATRISDLTDSLRKQRPKNLAEKEDQLYDKLVKRAQNLSENVRMVFSVAQPDKFVYYVERAEASSNRVTLQASAAPLDVTTWLKERLFNKSNVICTSATLATIGPNPVHPEEKGPNFFYFRRRIGLDPLERSDVLESILPLTFDYENNALLYLPRDLPEPAYGQGSDDYMKAIAREMYKLVKLSRGRAFLLFSSKRMLDRAYELMSPHLSYPLLKQGDMTRIELTRRFREEEGAVLFGLKSFWEGVDIAGEALSLVVIDKLPFDPPDDPVHEARVAQMKAAGENWFGIYVLPQAVLRLKQGLGRLLRARDDRGVMAILDTRLHTKGYGKMVLNALPPARRTASLREVERFFVPE